MTLIRKMLAISIMMTACVICASAQNNVPAIDSLRMVRNSIIKADSLDKAENAAPKGLIAVKNDSIDVADSLSVILQKTDSVIAADKSNLETAALQLSADSIEPKKKKRDWSTWRPSPQRAMWLAMVIPGGGQIYNRKYWKLPIIYGGIMGCLYAMNWNNMMYKDYSQAYLDIMDSDPQTQSYNKFLHLGSTINSSNEERYKTIFKNRKDRYRRWRDLSFFCLIGVYALSIIDAYVDAELSEFDISKDLSLKVAPAVINNGMSRNTLEASSIGVNVGLNF